MSDETRANDQAREQDQEHQDNPFADDQFYVLRLRLHQEGDVLDEATFRATEDEAQNLKKLLESRAVLPANVAFDVRTANPEDYVHEEEQEGSEGGQGERPEKGARPQHRSSRRGKRK